MLATAKATHLGGLNSISIVATWSALLLGASTFAPRVIRTIALDKTGTLTKNRPKVTDITVRQGESSSGLLSLAAAVEARSDHPLAGSMAALISKW